MNKDSKFHNSKMLERPTIQSETPKSETLQSDTSKSAMLESRQTAGSKAFAAAAAFVVATTFATPQAATVRAEEGAATAQLAQATLTKTANARGTALNLRVGKVMPLALPEGAEYSLRRMDGEALADGELLKLTAQNGLLLLEPKQTGKAILTIEAPGVLAQRIVIRIDDRSEDIRGGTLLSKSTRSGRAARIPAVAKTEERKASDLKPAPIAAATARATRFAIARTRSTPRSSPAEITSKARPASPKAVLAALPQEGSVGATVSLFETPIRTVSHAQVNPESNLTTQFGGAPELPAMLPPATVPGLNLNHSDVPSPGLPAIETPFADPPSALSPEPMSSNPAITPDPGDQTEVAAQISPNVPPPANLPAIRIPYRTQPAIPDEVARVANNAIARRPKLNVSTGMARILAFRQNILAVFFSDENVMDARAINARTLAITGKGSGKSTLAIFLARTPDDVVGRAVIYNIEVSPSSPQVVEVGYADPMQAETDIRAALNDPRVNVTAFRRQPNAPLTVRLTGQLRSQAEIDAAIATARLFVPDVISSLYIDPAALSLSDALGGSPLSGEGLLQTKLRGIFGNQTIRLTALPGGTTLTAEVDSAAEAEAILGILPYLDRKIQPIIVLRGAPTANKYYSSERPNLFGEDWQMTNRLKEVTRLNNVYAVRTARNAIAIYGSVRDRREYDTLRRYALLLPQLQDAASSSQSTTATGAPGAPNSPVVTSAASTTSVSAAAPALAAANGTAPVLSTSGITGLRGSNMPINGYEFPTQIQMFVRIEDESAAAVRLVTVNSSVVEIARDALKDLGVQIGSVGLLSETFTAGSPGSTVTTDNGGVITTTTNPATPDVTTRTVDPTFNQGSFLGGNGFIGTGGFANINPIRARINALYQNGAAKVLSNPNLTTVEGSDAQITIGGSRPVPSTTTTAAAGGTNQTSVEFRRFGIILTMRPTVADDDTIILQVRGDVTDLDFTTAINLGNAVIPGERVRSVDTTVTMREGDTLVLGGLITNEYRKQTSKVPFLGDLPIIGKLFQSKRFENNETELAIFLTPSIRRLRGSDNLRETILANPSFPELPGLQEGSNAFGLSTITNP